MCRIRFVAACLVALGLAGCSSCGGEQPLPVVCGNNRIDGDEECDKYNLGGQVCEGDGFLVCTEECKIDRTGCPSASVCGNGVAETGEACDGADLSDATCRREGYVAGTLGCQAGCGAFDYSGCCFDACVSGSSRCDARVGEHWVQECAMGPSGCFEWIDVTDCALSGAVCDSRVPPAVCVECVSDCSIAGETACAGDVVQTCTADALGCLTFTDTNDCAAGGQVCASGGLGVAGCVACIDECATAGDTACTGGTPPTRVTRCSAGADGCLDLVTVSDCGAFAGFCTEIDGAPECVTCLDACEPEGSTCKNNRVEVCAPGLSGCLEKSDGPDCALSGEECVEEDGTAQCLPPCSDQCIAGGSRCTADVVEVCALGFRGCLDWLPDVDCSLSGDVCDNSGGPAACVCDDVCTAGERRCQGTVRETCGLQPTGCLDWTGLDCALTGQACYGADGSPRCMLPQGEDCDAPYEIFTGVNTVTWSASTNDYLPTAPSCLTIGSPVGPDVVLSYASSLDGYVEITLDKHANNRAVMVASSAPCGTVTPLVCLTELNLPTMSTILPVSQGQTYYFYVIDTTSGSLPLRNPLTVTLAELPCIDTCELGAGRCRDAVAESCTLSPLGCHEWTATQDCAATGKFCNDATGEGRCLTCQDGCEHVADTRCTDTTAQECTEQLSGCAAWKTTLDCSTIPGAVCDDTTGAAACVLTTGEDCSSPYILAAGLNTVDWAATSRDYLISTPSCVTIGTVTGPDVVMRYTASEDGYLEYSLAKSDSQRYVVLVGTAPCGSVAQPLDCVSWYEYTWLGGVIPATAGTSYFFYLADTNIGSSSLPDPLDFTITPLPCIDQCAQPGARCNGDFRETCQVNALGCLDWALTEDCAATGEICDASTGSPHCVACVDTCTSGSRCLGSVVERCQLGANGCRGWVPGADCAPSGEVCFPATEASKCQAPYGESCGDSATLTEGTNVVDWVAVESDYMFLTPPCQTQGSVTGADVVLSYTAQTTGFLDIRMSKTLGQRHTFVVSDAVCGNLTAPLSCATDDASDVVVSTLQVTAGTTYYVYVTDTTHGAEPLPNPLVFEIAESICPSGAGGHRCPGQGATRCRSAITTPSTVGLPVPDAGGSLSGCGDDSFAAIDSIVIGGTETVLDVDVRVDVSHTLDDSIDIVLRYEDGLGGTACAVLSTDNGGSSDNYFNTVFDDEAAVSIVAGTAPFTGIYRPEEPLSVFDGLSAKGIWTLMVSDDAPGATGTFDGWELTLAYDGEDMQICAPQANGCLGWEHEFDCSTRGEQCADGTGMAQCLPCSDGCTLQGDVRCLGDVLETCGVTPQGCVDWSLEADCAVSHEICLVDQGGCVPPVGEDCTTPATIVYGSNTVDWLAFRQDYLQGPPSCQTLGATTGPDLVLRYTPSYFGVAKVTIDKAAGNRFSVVVSKAPCGSVIEDACFSDSVASEVTGTFAVERNAVYTLYVTDTTQGSATLPSPLSVDIECAPACTGGATRCSHDLVQTCAVGSTGCQEWITVNDCAISGQTCDAGGGQPACAACANLCPAAGTTRCNGSVSEQCVVGPEGCLEWQRVRDCSPVGQICTTTGGSAACVNRVGDTCADVYALASGSNTVPWNAVGREYVVSSIACSAAGPAGPDVVMSYTAQEDGYLDVVVAKPPGHSMALLVSEEACGTPSPHLACGVSQATSTIHTFHPINAGTTYYLYMVDTNAGTQTLPRPLEITVTETQCPQGLDADRCEVGGTRCAGEAVFTNATQRALTDGTAPATTCGAPGAVSSSFVVTRTNVIQDVDVEVDITHTWVADLDMWLRHDGGASGVRCVQLSTDNGSNGHDYTATAFDDEGLIRIQDGTAPFSGPHRPESPLSVFDGFPMNGTWTLYVSDDNTQDVGTLDRWSLFLGYDGENVQTCTVQGAGCRDWFTGVDCAATGRVCNDGSGTAQCLSCTDGCSTLDERRCVGNRLDTCGVGAQGCLQWLATQDCAASGLLCDPGTTSCRTCIDACTAGADRCVGSVAQACTTGASGCLEWATQADCAASGTLCDASAFPTCYVPVGEDCGSAVPIDFGSNSVSWSARRLDYLAATPSCVPGGVTTRGADVVLEYTAPFDGLVDVTFSAISANRWVVMSSDAPCGPLTGSEVCRTNLSSSSLTTTIDGVTGTTYTFYVADTTEGAFPLSTPLNVSVACSPICTAGAQRCNGEVIETCAPNAAGCVVWLASQDCAASGEVCDDSGSPLICNICNNDCTTPGAERCIGVRAERCVAVGPSCNEWQLIADCAPAGQVCDGTPSPHCAPALGDDCSAPYSLAMGTNTISWAAAELDYLTETPACVPTTFRTTGPDVVLRHVAQLTGKLRVVVSKPSSNRWVMIAGASPCGALEPSLACLSDIIPPTMETTIDVVNGQPYFFYLADTDSGAAPLSDPLTVTLSCADSCELGDSACNGDLIETCLPNAFGCRSLQPTTDCFQSGQTCDDFFGPPACADCKNYCGGAGLARCAGDRIEICTAGPLGCLSWVPDVDCAATGETCIDPASGASCITPMGDDCAAPFVLQEGANDVFWSGVTNDYLTSPPSCDPTPTSGPDVVLSYAATSSGAAILDVELDKPPGERTDLVISTSPCGVPISNIACESNATDSLMGGVYPILGGVTYWLYVVDTAGGAAPLSYPFTLTVNETECSTFIAAPHDEFPPNGGASSSLRPVLSVHFDVPIDPTAGIITVTGDGGTNLTYDLTTSPFEVFFTNDGHTLNVDSGVTFASGEQVSVSWFGLRDAPCGNDVAPPQWTFVTPTPSCTPGLGGMVGTSTVRRSSGLTVLNERYVVADASPTGWVYFGGTGSLHRMRKAGGTLENVVTKAGLTVANLGFNMLVAGSSLFTLERNEATSGVLFRISQDGGTSWLVQDFAVFPVKPADLISGATVQGGRIYMVTEEFSIGVDTEVWSVPVSPASVPATATLEATIPGERHCTALAMDSVNYYLACYTGERVIRINRSTLQRTLLSTAHDQNDVVNQLLAHDYSGDGVADALYLQVGTEQVYYFCDPAGSSTYTDLLVDFSSGTETDNYGLGLDPTSGALWAVDDDTFELVEIQ